MIWVEVNIFEKFIEKFYIFLATAMEDYMFAQPLAICLAFYSCVELFLIGHKNNMSAEVFKY
jgi:hypothetical protein